MDEFDALLEQPFADDVDWSTIQGMGTPPPRQHFAHHDALDDPFPDEIHALEERPLDQTGRPHTLARRQRQHGTSSVTAAEPSRAQHTAIREPSPRVQSDGDILRFLDPRLANVENEETRESRFAVIKQINSQAQNRKIPRKRSCSPDHASPAKRRKAESREAKSDVLNTFEGALECPICFDIMAAPYILSCGHTACGLCLSKWLHHKNKASCFSCRTRHKFNLIPNFVVDAVAAAYFEERQKNATEDNEIRAIKDKMYWETRRE